MAKKVGIPRGLFYYQYYPLWKTFFEELGAEIVVSDFTNKQILDSGVKSCVDEACLPVKLFYGHVLNLKDKVDYLFIPRFTSISKGEYICPKFGGLPDMIRHSLKELPEIIDTEVNLRKSKKNAFKAAVDVGNYFSSDRHVIKSAYQKALNSYREFRSNVRKGVLPGDILSKRRGVLNKSSDETVNIAIIGHVYNLYDNYMNMDMIYKLRSMGVNITTIEMLDGKVIDEKNQMLPKKMFWNFGRKAVGGAFHIMEREDIDGIIYLMSFGCGVDSFVCDLIERKVRNTKDIPFTVLTIDEHSGEAGMNTRLEAFIDMIRWRNRNEADVPAYG
ncbi:MAG: acyl-CoA dehydratase activase-related protein [Clostridia bacterium]|nr:acyl-CoA dehydratase activase-related protein [Clostridia bacterium]